MKKVGQKDKYRVEGPGFASSVCHLLPWARKPTSHSLFPFGCQALFLACRGRSQHTLGGETPHLHSNSNHLCHRVRHLASTSCHMRSGVTADTVCSLRVPCFIRETLVSCVSLDQARRLLYLSFPIGKMGDNNSTNL